MSGSDRDRDADRVAQREPEVGGADGEGEGNRGLIDNVRGRLGATGAATVLDGRPASDPAVDRALGQAGGGQAHESGARLHTDSAAAEAASALGAKAFTAGSDVYFGAGKFEPGSEAGQQLLAHELTHVEQARGVAAPRPGAYSVSDPGDRTEVSARSAAASGGVGGGGEGAAPGVIYREVDTAGTKIQAGFTPALGREDAARWGGEMGAALNYGEAGGEANTDCLQQFRAALLAGDTAEMKAKWKKVKSKDKSKLKEETDTILHMMRIWGPDSLSPMHEIGVNFATDIRFAQHILWEPDADAWKSKLTQSRLWNSFVDAEPKKDKLDPKSLKGLGDFIDDANTANAKKLFEKAFPPLKSDSALDDDWEKYVPVSWQAKHIKRLYAILADPNMMGGAAASPDLEGPPVAHVQAVSNGFYMVSKFKKRDDTSKPFPKQWKQLTYAFYWNGIVVLPLSSSGPKGGGTDHDMTGGDKSGTMDFMDPLTHFQGSALHEVGHAVGDKIRGDAWAASSAPPKWTPVAEAAFADALWLAAAAPAPAAPAAATGSGGDAKDAAGALAKVAVGAAVGAVAGATGAAGAAASGKAKLVTVDEAKVFLTEVVRTGKAKAPAGWEVVPAVESMKAQGFDKQPLYAVAKANWNKDPEDVYHHSHEGNDGQVYGYFTRWDNQFGKYTKKAYDEKVSWYSMSSPAEWFAEQYAHYYRHGRSGDGLDSSVKAYLDDLHTRTLSNPGSDPASSGAGTASAPSASPGGSAGGDAAGPSPKRRKGPFPW